LKKTFGLLLLFSCFLPVAHCQFTYWQQQVNYKIDVTLNDKEHTLEGYVKMDYFNNSPDTLSFIWIHIWPNAWKNDHTSFSDQELINGNTQFYFSSSDKRGYINRLSFKVNTITAKTEDHPLHQDIIKLILPQPLVPNSHCVVETPFHVKLPYNFSGSGHIDQSYQITQWYPQPAVYDKKGWHPLPYMAQGGFYNELGNYDVEISVPENYVVAATGSLQNTAEKEWMKHLKNIFLADTKKENTATIPSSSSFKKLHYLQADAYDFVWFADKAFMVKTDTLQLPSGKIITLNAFYNIKNQESLRNSIAVIKKELAVKSKYTGTYPYDVLSLVENIAAFGKIDYSTIKLITPGGSQAVLKNMMTLQQRTDWFYGIVEPNERDFPWMNEGINTYYNQRYPSLYTVAANTKSILGLQSLLQKKIPASVEKLLLPTIIRMKKDQPINTTAADFSALNYRLIAGEKAAAWVQLLEAKLGTPLFDSCMNVYYQRWAFKHPYPEDFKKILEELSGKNLDDFFYLLTTKGNMPQEEGDFKTLYSAKKQVANSFKKDIRFSSFFNLQETDKHHYIASAPVAGYNFYDKLMLGAVLHNYSLPVPKFQALVVPLFSLQTKQVNGIGKISYSWHPGTQGQKIALSLTAAMFNGDSYADSTGKINNLRFSKIVPSVKIVFANKNPLSTVKKFIQWKTYLINEKQVFFSRDTVQQIDIITYPNKFRYINQLQLVIENSRALYPYAATLQLEQGDGFIRTAFTGNYYFNYKEKGGLNVRLFGGKFFYTGEKTFLKKFATDAYHLNLTGPKGNEDYTYSNYFIGRNEFKGLPSYQIMIRDGGFKIRTDLLNEKIGKTDNWLAALNLTSTIPDNINPLQKTPLKIPLKVFLDAGTYAEAWKKNASTGKFVYEAGLQLSLFKNTLNVYIPLLMSKEYRNYFKSYVSEKKFLSKLSFSIDIQNLSVQKLIPSINF
jgi:hypothetical protein